MSRKESFVSSLCAVLMASGMALPARAAGDSGRSQPPSRSESSPAVDSRTRALVLQLLGSEALPSVDGDLDSWKKQNLERLFTTDASRLDWPPMPRDYIENQRTRQFTSNTSFGVRSSFANPIWVNFKVSSEFRYAVKTAFIVIAGRPKAGGPVRADDGPVRFDPKRYAAYPNVRPGSPMVGMCAFEMRYEMEQAFSAATEGTVELPVLPYANSTTTNAGTRGFVHTHFSPFFQLDPEIAVEAYLNTVCDGLFRAQKQEMMVAQATGQILSILWNQNPHSTCRPPDADAPGGEEGDASCMSWHRRNFGTAIQSITVPRCVFNANGAHACVLRAKRAGIRCPLAFDRATNRYSEFPEEPAREGPNVAFTNRVYAYPCDSVRGLRCQLTSPPLKIGSVRLTEGEARCQAASP